MLPCHQAEIDHPQSFSTRFASVYLFCVASLREPECRPEELQNGLDKGGQKRQVPQVYLTGVADPHETEPAANHTTNYLDVCNVVANACVLA